MIRTSARHYCTVIVLAFVAIAFAGIGTAQAATKPVPSRQTDNNVNTGDSVDLIRETQIGIREKDYAGLVWWIPFEFWEYAGAKQNLSPERVEETFKALKNYSVVAVFAAKVTPLGAFTFYSPDQLKKKVVIRDSSGVEYVAVDELSPEAQVLSSVMRPILSNAIGKAGENFALLFYPATGKTGTAIADARAAGQFSVVVKDLLGKSETIYQWRLPLTSVAPPKYCPVGNERMNANWNYCPWHGAALSGSAATTGK